MLVSPDAGEGKFFETQILPFWREKGLGCRRSLVCYNALTVCIDALLLHMFVWAPISCLDILSSGVRDFRKFARSWP